MHLFAIPQQNGEQAAQIVDTDQGLSKSAMKLFSKILYNLHNIITQKAKAQTPTSTPIPTLEDNINTLLSLKKYRGCNLAEANLVGASLTGADLTLDEMGMPANLFQANLIGVDLTGQLGVTVVYVQRGQQALAKLEPVSWTTVTELSRMRIRI